MCGNLGFKISKDLKYYFGNPHCHTGYSDGALTPYDALSYAKDKGLDFLFITDHSHFLIDEDNIPGNQIFNKWIKTDYECKAFNIRNNDFLGVRGFEMTSSNWGHINVLNSETFVEAKKDTKKLESFIEWLTFQKNIVASFNHPSRSFKYIKCSNKERALFGLMEVGNGSPPRRYIRTDNYYYKALDRGWILGAINGQDNHRGNWGDVSNLSVILSKSLSKDDFMEALRNRRTYSTETGSLILDYRLNGLPMGSIIKLNNNNKLKFNIYARDDKTPINEIQLLSNGGKIVKGQVFNCSRELNWDFSIEPEYNKTWYVIKVIHNNKKWGISSGIFIDYKRNDP